MVQIIHYNSFNNSIKNTNVKNFVINELYKKAGYKNNNNNHYGLVITINNDEKLIDIYGKYDDKMPNNFKLKGVNKLNFYGNLIICKYNDLQKTQIIDISFEELNNINFDIKNIIFNSLDYKITQTQKNEVITPTSSTPITPILHNVTENFDEDELTYEQFDF